MSFKIVYVASIYGVFAAIVAFIISPLQFLKVQKQQTNRGYVDLLYDAVKLNGFAVLYIGAVPYTCMSFLSNLAFGFSDYLFFYINQHLTLFLFSRIFILSLIGGVFETVFIFYHEVNEVCRNKLNLIETSRKRYIKLIPVMIIRNSISWLSVALMFELDYAFHLPFVLSILFGIIFSILFSCISIPLDVVITRNCGAKIPVSTVKMISFLIQEKKSHLFSGAIMRILQIVIFTLITFLTMICMRNFIYCK